MMSNNSSKLGMLMNSASFKSTTSELNIVKENYSLSLQRGFSISGGLSFLCISQYSITFFKTLNLTFGRGISSSMPVSSIIVAIKCDFMATSLST